MQDPSRISLHAAPLLVAAILLVLYLATMAPGLSWANGGSDGGDLITAAATGGVAHPTGYPVYLLAARLMQFLPAGSLAFRTNLLSAISMTGAALLVFAIVRHTLADLGEMQSATAGVVAALAFGLSPLAWSQAVITEVYALHVFFIALLLYLLTTSKAESYKANGAIGLVQGLAIGNHVLAGLMSPGVVMATCLRTEPGPGTDARNGGRLLWSWSSLGSLGAGIMAGLLVYVTLPLRARAYPPVNWGNPTTPARFIWLVSGQLYQDRLLHIEVATLLQHLQAWARLTLQQFGLPGLVIAVLGLTIFFGRSRIYYLTLLTAVAFTAFSLQYAVEDSYIYLLPVYLCFAIWIGVAIGRLGNSLSRYVPQAHLWTGLASLIYLTALASGTWLHVDASRDQAAEAFGGGIMDKAPAEALIFAQGDRAVFALWYFHFALARRQDLAVIATELLPFDWYRDNLRHTYPSLELPLSTPDVWVAAIQHSNPGRSACFTSAELATLACNEGE